MSKERDEAKVIRGREAHSLLRNPLLVQALADIEDRYLGQWKASALGAQDAREAAYHMVRACIDLRTHLTQTVTDGKLASVALEEGRQRKQAESEYGEPPSPSG